jgi:glutaredoxin 2
MKLYTYEHCPFCVRVKMILNLTKTPYEEVILLNDDEETPIKLCGAKQVPILEYDNKILVESLEIVDFINQKNNLLSTSSQILNTKIENWISSSYDYLIKLAFPRLLKLNLPEFKTQSAVNYFRKKKESSIKMTFEEALSQTNELIQQAQEHQNELSEFLPDGTLITKNDIILLPILRLLSCVEGLQWNEKVLKYANNMAKICNIDMHNKIS